MSDTVNTIVLGDNVILREGICRLLEGGRFQVDHCQSGAGFIQKGWSGRAPDLFVIVIDDKSCAIIADIKRHFPDAKIVALPSTDSGQLMHRAIQLGAVGYLVGCASAGSLLMSLEVVLANGAVFPAELLTHLAAGAERIRTSVTPDVPRRADGSALSGLSAREVGILEALTLGESNKTIARRLQIAEATVKVHVKAILRKVRVKNRTQAAMWAVNNASVLDQDPGDHVDAQPYAVANPHAQNGAGLLAS